MTVKREMADAVPGRVEIKFCQPCLRKDTRNVAGIYCEDCGEYQCGECEKIHQLFPVMSKHKLVNADKAGDVGSKYDMKDLDQCKEHQKLMKYFCEDENMPCCGKCAIVSHRKCNHVVEIEKTKELKNLDLLDIQREFLEIEDKFQKIAIQLEKAKCKFTKDATEIFDKIQTMQDNVNEMFEVLKQAISKDIAKFQKQEFDDFDAKTEICDSCIEDLKRTIVKIETIVEQGSPVQQLIMAHHLKDRKTELKMKTEKLSVEVKDFLLNFDFDDSLKLPPANHAMPGKLTVNFAAAPEYFTGVTVNRQKELKVSLKLLVSIDLKKGKGDVDLPLMTGLDFLSDGRLVTVDNYNQRCMVFSQNLKMLHSFVLSEKPHGIIVVSDDQVAITTEDGFKLIFLKISNTNKISLVRECDVEKKFQSISVIDNDNMLVGCVDDPRPIRVVSMRGKVGELGILFYNRTYPRDSSACTYIRNRNKVVFSDIFAHTVSIYDTTTNTRVEVKDEKIIQEPRGVTVGPNDCIFVCSELTNSVVQISHSGQIMSSHVLDMWYPRSVCVSKDNTRLALSNSCDKERKLQLFNVELM